MQFTRRQFLKVGLAGAVALVAIRAAYGPFMQNEAGTDSRFAFLRPGERVMLAAIAAVILAGALPAAGCGSKSERWTKQTPGASITSV